MKQIEIIVTITKERCNNELIHQFVLAGASIFRLNASHLCIDDLNTVIHNIRCYSPAQIIMLDLPGPEWRCYGFENPIKIDKGSLLYIYSSDVSPSQSHPSIISSYPSFKDLKPVDNSVSFMNGELIASILSISDSLIQVQFINEGVLRPNAHISIGGFEPHRSYLSDSDKILIHYALDNRIDQIALSMVRSPNDVLSVRNLIQTNNETKTPKLVVKFETKESLQCIEQICSIADAVFVARGDLALNTDSERIPIVQKVITSIGKKTNTPVYLATQILSTMVNNPIPLRAEVSDLANAIYDGCSGVTLSEETAIGSYPIEAVKTAKRIIDKTQSSFISSQYDLSTNPVDYLRETEEFRVLFAKIQDVATRIWTKGWAEANAGNLSVNVTDIMHRNVIRLPDQKQSTRYYLGSTTGSRYRHFQNNLSDVLVLVALDDDKQAFYPNCAHPTSEWVTHKVIHDYFHKKGFKTKVVLHTHPSDVIAISHSRDYDIDIIEKLYKVLPELSIYLPEGIQATTYAPPGSDELAYKSLKALQESCVFIWQYHGLVSCAETIDEAFDYLEIVNKAAEIYLKLKNI